MCGQKGKLAEESVFERAPDGEVLQGVLTCTECGRWYRVEEGIADLVRDGLREVADDRAFLRRHSVSPLVAGKPFGMDGPAPAQTEEDRRIIDEGRHWGDFMQRFWDVGDRSIFDLRAKGSHPPFYVKGVLEPDDRDEHRRWGIYPPRTGELLFSRLYKLAGRRGVDVGCGGGQFGLEAARQGVNMFGFDPSFRELSLARRHARETGVRNIDYLRAEPANPPFAHGCFHLMMAKDSLHHVPNLDEVFPRVLSILKRDGLFICHEHTHTPRLRNRLIGFFAERLHQRIRGRYGTSAVPEEFLRDSANEDVSAALIRPLLEEYFSLISMREDLFLANDLEMYAHFAWGKRRWVSRPVYITGCVIERLLIFLGDRQHISFVGRHRQT